MTYQESTGHQDDNAAVAGGLGVEGGDLVAHLLEGQALCIYSLEYRRLYGREIGEGAQSTSQ